MQGNVAGALGRHLDDMQARASQPGRHGRAELGPAGHAGVVRAIQLGQRREVEAGRRAEGGLVKAYLGRIG